jgi:hypothetical protein
MKTTTECDDSTHQKILHRFFRWKHDAWSQYKDRAQVIWEGEHYVLIQTGMSENKSRYVWLADKAGLLAPDEEDSPLAQLAGATVHPAQVERARQDAEILHDSNQSEDNEGVFKGRWCKARKAQCIAYSEQRDASYEHELPGWIEDYERREAEAKELEQEERRFAARLVRYARKRLPPRAVRMDCRFDNGIYGTRHLSLGEDLGGADFEASPHDWRVQVTTFRGGGLRLTESQFQRLVGLLAEFVAEEDTSE